MALTKISGEVIQSGINIGIVTASTINVGSAVTIHTGGFQVGTSDLHSTGITVKNVNSTGVVTATTFVGSLTGNVTGNVVGNATGLSNTPNITVGSINASSAIINGNVSVAGTVTYEDVTNVDSVGVVTARSGVHVTSGNLLIGTINSTGTASQPLQVTGGAYVSGNLGVGVTNPLIKFDVLGAGRISGDVYLTTGSPGSPGYVYLNSGAADSTDTYLKAGGTAGVWSAVQITGNWDGSSNTGGKVAFYTAGTERGRFDNAGNFGLGTITPNKKLDIYGNSNTDFSRMGLIGISNAQNAPTLSTLDNNTTTNYGTFQLTSIFAGDTHIRSYWGVSVDINDSGLGDSASASQARIPSTSSFTVNSRSSSTAYRNLFAIRTSGLVVTPNNIGGGLDIGYRKSVSITGSFAANTWYNTGIDRTTDGGAIYLVSCSIDTYASGQSYQMRYVGWFVLPQQASNSGDASTISLHRAGHAPNSETLQLRTLLTGAGDSKIYLQWLSNFALTLDGSGGKTLQIVLHRFATPIGG